MKNFKNIILFTTLLVLVLSMGAFSEPSNINIAKTKALKLSDVANINTAVEGTKFVIDLNAPNNKPNMADKAPQDIEQGGEDIANATVIPTLPATLTGTTAGYVDDYEATEGGCTNTNAPDVVYSYTPDDDYRIHLISCNSSYWTKIIVFETDETTTLACNQYSDSCLPDYRAAIYDLDVAAGTTYYFVIDGGIGGPSGAYEIDIQVQPQADLTFLHPALADNGQGYLVEAYEYSEYDAFTPWFYSLDDGMSWGGGNYWDLGGIAGYPAVDYWGEDSVFYGTMVPPAEYYSGKPFYLVDMQNISTGLVGGSYWNWTNPFHDMIMVDIACDASNEHWNFGFAGVIQSYDVAYSNIALYFYPTSETGGSLNGWIAEGCYSVSTDIDLATHRGYNAWGFFDDADHEYKFIIQQASSWYWDDSTTGWDGAWDFTGDAGDVIMYPAIASYDGNILLAIEYSTTIDPNNQDIVCWWSGGDENVTGLSGNATVVAETGDAERYPEIQHITGDVFVVTYIMNNAVYASVTEDAGLTFSTPEMVSLVGDSVISEYRAVDIAESNGTSVKIAYEYVNIAAKANPDILVREVTYEAYVLPDTDGDGFPDATDNCPSIYNDPQTNSDGDSYGDACDNCPTVSNETQTNSDGDTYGDACDNCPNVDNQDQQNSDTDSYGDLCDNCPDVANEDQLDSNGNDVGDACDYICGDANDNTEVNILDITYLISYLYKGGPDPVSLVGSDVNSSGTPEVPQVNILDVTYLIAYLYKGGPDPNCF